MTKDTIHSLLKMIGMRHTDVNAFWTNLMIETKGQIAGWLLETDIKEMKELLPYLRQNQIKNSGSL